jgi:hypothetical protein
MSTSWAAAAARLDGVVPLGYAGCDFLLGRGDDGADESVDARLIRTGPERLARVGFVLSLVDA